MANEYSLPTCKVKSADGYVIINESDYDEKVHGKKLADDFGEEKPAAETTKETKAEETKADKATK